MQRLRLTRVLALGGGAFLAGCGAESGPELAYVTGVVTLDNQPLANAHIVFQPVGDNASPSVADTTHEGEFELSFTRNRQGAMIGEHHVRITTETVLTDDSGQETVVPERLPASYHQQSQRRYQIEPGDNHFKIELQSSGEPLQSAAL